MAEDCCSHTSAGSQVCELPSLTVAQKPRLQASCPQCKQGGKAVQGQTVKAMVSDTLRSVKNEPYFFCRTPDCPVVYFTKDGDSVFTVSSVREVVYQKEQGRADVPICYCFQHTAGQVRDALPEGRSRILEDINAGIQADQCACDLRNPQGSCCLGNVRALIRESEQTAREA